MIDYKKIMYNMGHFQGYNDGLYRHHMNQYNVGVAGLFNSKSYKAHQAMVRIKNRAIKNGYSRLELGEEFLKGRKQGLKEASVNIEDRNDF